MQCGGVNIKKYRVISGTYVEDLRCKKVRKNNGRGNVC